MSPSEFVLITTIRIETVIPNGISTGTGFFFSFLINEEEDTSVPAIVTNKHVVKNAITGKLIFSIRDDDGNLIPGQYYNLQLDQFEKRWIMHPDPNVDLCILPIANIHRDIEDKYKKHLYYASFTKKDIPDKNEIDNFISKIEEITVVGYPDGIWDSYNNMPIARRGITATALQLNFNNKPEFLVDAAIYGGSSGSPVLIFNQGYFSPANGGLVAGNRIKLVGVIHAVAQHSVDGEIRIIDAPVTKTPISTTLIPNNLGVAIHARKIMDFEPILMELQKNQQ
jgi:hypothetical protein